MGYHVTILRTKEGNPDPISMGELSDVISKYPALDIIENSITKDESNFLSFDEENGELWCKNPEKEELIEMLKLAKELNARVRGDEFETYKDVNETYIHPDDKKLVNKNREKVSELVKQTKRKQILINVCIFSFFGILALITGFCSKGN